MLSNIYNWAFLWNQLTANNRKLFWQKFRLRWKFWYSKNFDNFHCVKSVRIRNYPIRMRENTDQNNSEHGHFLCSFYVKEWIMRTNFMPVVSLYNIGKLLMFSGVIERVHWHVKHFKWRCKMKISSSSYIWLWYFLFWLFLFPFKILKLTATPLKLFCTPCLGL